ncbi:hypothetical protein EVJ58_g9713, partial [Rhodofomes roseus]
MAKHSIAYPSHLASQELANVYQTWINIAPESVKLLYPPRSEVITQALSQEREENAALRAQLNKQDKWRKPLANTFNQLYEKLHADHDLVNKGVLATSDELKREVDSLRSTLKAVSGRIDSIAVGPASYAAATASSKGKGRERAPSPPHIHFDGQKTTDPWKRKDRPQTPSDTKAAQAADAAKAKRAQPIPFDGECVWRHHVPGHCPRLFAGLGPSGPSSLHRFSERCGHGPRSTHRIDNIRTRQGEKWDGNTAQGISEKYGLGEHNTNGPNTFQLSQAHGYR